MHHHMIGYFIDHRDHKNFVKLTPVKLFSYFHIDFRKVLGSTLLSIFLSRAFIYVHNTTYTKSFRILIKSTRRSDSKIVLFIGISNIEVIKIMQMKLESKSILNKRKNRNVKKAKGFVA